MFINDTAGPFCRSSSTPALYILQKVYILQATKVLTISIRWRVSSQAARVHAMTKSSLPFDKKKEEEKKKKKTNTQK